MALVAIFLLGMSNFAMLQAVRKSGHPMLRRSPWFVHQLGGRVTLVTDFMLLLTAMLFAAQGGQWSAWLYAGYTGVNAFGVWLILTRRV